jgi:hypothetical protein
VPRNCAGLKDLGLRKDGAYFVDVDGTGAMPPVEVSCNIDEGKTGSFDFPGTVSTVKPYL